MTPALREPRFAVRYALWRLARLGRASDPCSDRAARIRWELPRDLSPEPDVELWIIGRSGETLERIVFETTAGVMLAPDSLFDLEKRARDARSTVAPTERLRWVTPGLLLQLPGQDQPVDLTDPQARERALRRLSCQLSENDTLIWDLGRHDEQRLMSQGLFELCLWKARRDPRELYQDLYESLLLSLARPIERVGMSLETDLFGERIEREPQIFEEVCEVGWWNQRIKPVSSASEISRAVAVTNSTELRRDLFSADGSLTLEQIYVRHRALLSWPVPERNMSIPWIEDSISLLYRWWAEEHSRRTGRPLLLLGSFGAGKSSLMTIFAEKLARDRPEVLPILVPLRDLRSASSSRPLDEALADHVRRRFEIDLGNPPRGVTLCLLCDGFDELNLFFVQTDAHSWVGECFRALRSLAEREAIHVVISSRPILFMDVRRRDFEGAECPVLELRLFEPDEIELWCAKYRRAAGLDDFFTASSLASRDLLDVARTPLILYMLARIHQFEEHAFREERSYTQAEIYRWFIDWTQSGGYRHDRTKHRVPSSYRDILREIARCFYLRGDGFAPEEEILVHIRSVFGEAPDRIPADRNLLVAHMLQPLATEDSAAPHLLEFTHQSFRDYLFAEWIWSRLEPARLGQGLDAETWNELGLKTVPASEVRYLDDMISTAPWDEALALYLALDQTENPHQYWSRWLTYAWERLLHEKNSDSIEALRGRVTTTASRAATLATLGFVLRTRCCVRLSTLAAKSQHREAPAGLDAKHLDALLHLLRTFPDQGVGSDNRRVLTANLSGLRLMGVALTGHQLENLDLRGARMRGVNFSFSRWLDVDLRGADLTKSNFVHCLLTFSAADGAVFREANFSDALLKASKRASLDDADFTQADFHRSRFLDLCFRGCRFVGNRWDAASRLSSAESQSEQVIECELDSAAWDFFLGQGYELVGCRLVEEDEP